MTHLEPTLRDRIEDAYAQFLAAFDDAGEWPAADAAEALRRATDRLMQGLARVMIELEGEEA